MIIIGIDPGRTGGFAVLDAGGDLLDVVDLPTWGAETDPTELAALLEAVAPASELFVGVESPFPNNQASSVSQMRQGIGFGQILGVLGAMHIRHERLRPLDWKKTMSMPMGGGLKPAEKKEASRQRARALWPHKASEFERVKDDGRAEAALIGEATRRRLAL